jgi:hypothetical protein
MATTGKKGGSAMIWVIGGLILVAGGIGAYFLLRKPKEDEDAVDTDTDTDTTEVIDTGSGSGSSTSDTPTELNDSTKVKAFQDWLDTNKPCWVLDSDGKYKNLSKNVGKCDRNTGGNGYGNYGKNTANAWKSFGAEYLKKPVIVASSNNTNTNLSKDIDTIIKSATGTKADKSYLQKANADFVKNWAKAIKNDRSAFSWANQIYRTKTGDKVLDYNPINTTHYSKDNKYIGFENKFANTTATYYTKGKKIGKVTDYAFQNGVMLYIPEAGTNKWFKASDATKTKPKSSFDGITDEIEFANFDNNLDLNL